jgi:integrase/recombinase XerD
MITAVEWIKEYETYLTVVKNRAVNTVRAYSKDLELLHKFALAGRSEDWGTFTEQNAIDYVRYLKSTSRDTAVSRKVYALRGFFKFLRKKQVIGIEPFEDIEFERLHRALPRVLSVQEMNRLLGCIRIEVQALAGVPCENTFLTIRDRCLLEVPYAAALRVSELCNLNWEDIDLARREVRVLGKGNKERICPLGQYALESLLDYARHFEEHWENKPEGARPVFLSMWNRRILTRTIPRTITKWVTKAGIKKHVNPHCFRHSAATHMLENGADIRVIQNLLGHASLITTEIYTHVAKRKVKSVHANTHPRA